MSDVISKLDKAIDIQDKIINISMESLGKMDKIIEDIKVTDNKIKIIYMQLENLGIIL